MEVANLEKKNSNQMHGNISCELIFKTIRIVDRIDHISGMHDKTKSIFSRNIYDMTFQWMRKKFRFLCVTFGVHPKFLENETDNDWGRNLTSDKTVSHMTWRQIFFKNKSPTLDCVNQFVCSSIQKKGSLKSAQRVIWNQFKYQISIENQSKQICMTLK